MEPGKLIKDINRIDRTDICADWLWLLDNQKEVILVSCIGDMFLIGNDDAIYWLDIGMAELTCVADNLTDFQNLLSNDELVENWFLPHLVEQLIKEGKVLNENEVYSFKIPPILGGDFSPSNFDKTDLSVHFSLFGQIHKQIWDVKNGTKINEVNIKEKGGHQCD